ncbi:acetylcholinesterase-1-like [Ornithodoros turicata]|uniref:acetylcholinesterase-1-like n=1 Tax=Ornithodoros turicata TaxID=34597 RepID=UPI0031386AD6
MIFVTNADGSPTMVTTTQGSVRGVRSCHGLPCVEAFLGIPYAEPPIGKLRFKKPVPKQPWSEVWNASQLPPACFQRKGNFPRVPWQNDERHSVEDCLYLNVWVPQEKKGLLPVMVWIHGGSFRMGSTDLDMYSGETLSSYGRVAVVSMNYRLGSLGFLNGGIPDVPGNMGLWDQHLALQWVKRNIAAFGGDPSRITIFGESVGGVSVGIHAVSPLNRGIFNRIIMQSGTPYWALPWENHGALDRSMRLAKSVGCVQNNGTTQMDQAIVRCLQELPAEDILKAELSLFPIHLFTFMPSYGDALVPTNPTQAIKEGRMLPVDIMVGSNSDEGTIAFYTLIPEGVPSNWTAQGMDLNQARTFISNVFHQFPPAVVQSIIKHYLDDVEPSDSSAVFKAMTDSAGNFLLDCPTVFAAESFSAHLRNVYGYQFAHRPSVSFWPEAFGVTHTEEIPFVFGLPVRYNQRGYSADDTRMSETVMNAWTSFARTGVPELPHAAAWRPYGSRGHPYALFKHGSVRLQCHLNKRNCDLWRKIF